MKKALLLIIAIGFMFNAYSQQLDSLPDTTKLTLSKVYSDVKAGLSGLATSLKVPASHVYGVLVKQQVAYSIINVIVVLGLFFFCWLAQLNAKINYRHHLNLCKERSGNNDPEIDESANGVVSFFLTITSIVCGIAGICFFAVNIKEIVTGFTNPEYGAIKEIINFVK